MGKKKVMPDEDVDGDVMAWGQNKKQYYQQKDDEYSSLSEQVDEAQHIYHEHLDYIGDADYDQLPSEDQISSPSQQVEDQISKQYLKTQIMLTIKIIKQTDASRHEYAFLLKRACRLYLLILMTLIQLKVPYIQQHPIVTKILPLKQTIQTLSGLLEDLDQQQIDQDQEEIPQSSEYELDEQEQRQGLMAYEKFQKESRNKKMKNKEKNKVKVQPEVFQKVRENQGRLINEKMSKNKGLMKRRKKIDGNSRVKLRRKFEIAKKKYRSKGHVHRANPGRGYQGEAAIRYGRLASVKIK